MALFLAGVFVLALCKVEDNDAFMHLSVGREIWTHRAIPAVEPFLEATRGQPFDVSYRSWLFGLAYYLAFLAGGLTGVVLLKAAVVTLCFAILLRDSLLPRGNLLLALCVLSGIVIAARHRFVERPDTVLIVCLAFSIHALRAFVHRGSRLIWALPLVHVLWANCHTSVSVMAVPFAAVLGGGLLQRFAARGGEPPEGTPTPRQLRVILAVFALSFAASLVSPYGLSQYTYGAKILGVAWYKQEILELQPPTWATSKATFVLAGSLVLSFLAAWRRIRFIDLALVLPFVGLSFTSLRFLSVGAVVAGPVLARNLAAAAERLNAFRSPLAARLLAAAAVLWLVAYPGLVVEGTGGFGDPEKRFGFGVNEETVPEGALAYLDRIGHTGTVLNTFQWGAYVIWRDFPRRRPIQDARGSLPVTLLEQLNRAMGHAATLDELSAAWSIQAIVTQYPLFPPGGEIAVGQRDPALSHPGWALVYWDDVALVYVRRAGPLRDVAGRDEYRIVRPARSDSSLRWYLGEEGLETALFSELDRNIRETSSSRGYSQLGFVLNEKGRYREALDAFARVRPHGLANFLPTKFAGMGEAQSRLGETGNALASYRKALRFRSDPQLLTRVAELERQQGNLKAAVRSLEDAVRLAPRNPYLYQRLASLYEETGDKASAAKVRAMLQVLLPTVEGEEHFKAGLSAYGAGRLGDARDSFLKSIAANPASAPALSNLGFVYYDLGRLDEALQAQSRAVDVDPGYANAHYGLAQTYQKLGRKDLERRHWEEYLRLEPKGYYSRRAREELERLAGR